MKQLNWNRYALEHYTRFVLCLVFRTPTPKQNDFNPLSANPTNGQTHTQTSRHQIADELLVFDHFVEMAQNEIAFLIILYKKNW